MQKKAQENEKNRSIILASVVLSLPKRKHSECKPKKERKQLYAKDDHSCSVPADGRFYGGMRQDRERSQKNLSEKVDAAAFTLCLDTFLPVFLPGWMMHSDCFHKIYKKEWKFENRYATMN